MTTIMTLKPGELFPLRQRTGTAADHNRKEMRDFGAEDLERLSPKEAVFFMANIMWGSTTEIPCPHCGTVDEHYWSLKELRWKCRACGKRFSVTSGTVFADRKLPLVKILKMAFDWSTSASGLPANQLHKKWKVPYKTAFTVLHKLREGLLRGHNAGMLCGVAEMDGMDVNGRGYKKKRNRTKGPRSKGKAKVDDELLEPEPDFVGPPLPPKWGKTEKQPEDRRIMIVMRLRGAHKGKGAVRTRIAIALTESTKTVTAMAQRFASTESVIMSDEDPSYASFSGLFASHRTINHSIAYSKPDGTNNNQAESFNARMRRAVHGVYLCPSNKYLADYAAEQAWREDVCKMPSGKKLAHLFRIVMGVGMSLWWRGYTHGHHRKVELLVEGMQPADGRGKKKGAKVKPPR